MALDLNAASCALLLKLSPRKRGNEPISASCGATCVLSLQHAPKGTCQRFTSPQDAPKMICERLTGLLQFIVYIFLDLNCFVLNSYQASRFCDRRETVEQ